MILDVETGERVLHFAELDPRATEDDRRALVLRPMVRLKNETRYIVAIRGLIDAQGEAIPPPEAFKRLRDGRTALDFDLEALSDRYETDIFDPLEAAGIARGGLQLAWDFTTQASEEPTVDMLAVREQIIAYYAANTPAIQVVSVEDQPEGEEHTFRRIELTLTVPLFLDNPEPYGSLTRDADGNVIQNGTVDVPFTVLVPMSVANRPAGSAPVRVMQFGHGFFGGRGEIHSFADSLADERELIVVAADWWGMTEEDRDVVGATLVEDTSNLMRFTDRVHQGMANFIALGYAATGPLAELPELVDAGGRYDPSTLYYYGISQGGILGGTFMGLTPLIDKGILSVGGAVFSFMMFRARPFLPFLALLSAVTQDALDQQKITVMTQTAWDRIDPITYAPWVLESPLESGPATRQVLLQIGIGDDQVPNFASHLHARALGVPSLLPRPRDIPALEATEGPAPSAMVEFDFGIDPLPGIDAVPPTQETEAHEGVRRLDAAKEQLDRFFQPGGVVENTCDGACDPE